MRTAAARPRQPNPFYHLSFYTSDDADNAQFIAPRFSPDLSRIDRHHAAVAAGQRMGVELTRAMLRVLAEGGTHMSGAIVIRHVFAQCQDAALLIGFADVLAQAMVDAGELFAPEQWWLRHEVASERRAAHQARQCGAETLPPVTPRVTLSDPRHGLAVTACATDGSLRPSRRAA